MIRFTLRLFGVLFFSAAFVALVVDGTRSIAASEIVLTPLGQTWYDLGASSLNTLQAGIQRGISPWLWDPVFVWVLQQPTFAVLGVIGILLLLLGRRRVRHAAGYYAA